MNDNQTVRLVKVRPATQSHGRGMDNWRQGARWILKDGSVDRFVISQQRAGFRQSGGWEINKLVDGKLVLVAINLPSRRAAVEKALGYLLLEAN